jgi:hypothetical protein
MSSKITQEKYDLVKIERIKHFLESSAEKGKPKFYEIFVDNLKAVDKTDDPSQFDEYLVYMGEDTRMVKVLIYTSTENCPRNDKFIFTVTSPEQEKAEKRRQELSGIELQEKIESVVRQEREKINTELLKTELEQVKEELEEANRYIGQLEKQLEESKSSKSVAKENLGEVISIALEGLVRRNTHLLSGIPLVGQGLAGVVEKDNRRLEEQVRSHASSIEQGQATFRKTTFESNSHPLKSFLSKEEQETLEYFNELKRTFSETELLQVLEIIGMLSSCKENINSVLDLLSDNEKEVENRENKEQDVDENDEEIPNL